MNLLTSSHPSSEERNFEEVPELVAVGACGDTPVDWALAVVKGIHASKASAQGSDFMAVAFRSDFIGFNRKQEHPHASSLGCPICP